MPHVNSQLEVLTTIFYTFSGFIFLYTIFSIFILWNPVNFGDQKLSIFCYSEVKLTVIKSMWHSLAKAKQGNGDNSSKSHLFFFHVNWRRQVCLLLFMFINPFFFTKVKTIHIFKLSRELTITIERRNPSEK